MSRAFAERGQSVGKASAERWQSVGGASVEGCQRVGRPPAKHPQSVGRALVQRRQSLGRAPAEGRRQSVSKASEERWQSSGRASTERMQKVSTAFAETGQCAGRAPAERPQRVGRPSNLHLDGKTKTFQQRILYKMIPDTLFTALCDLVCKYERLQKTTCAFFEGCVPKTNDLRCSEIRQLRCSNSSSLQNCKNRNSLKICVAAENDTRRFVRQVSTISRRGIKF